MIVIIDTLNLAERLQNLQEEKHSKLTIGAFFEFMRTAYQVNDSCEGLATILSANSEVDWQELTKINLDLIHENNKVTNDKCNLNNQEQQYKNIDSVQELLLQTTSSKETNTCTSNSMISSQFSVVPCNTIYETCNKDDFTQESNNVEIVSNKCLETGNNINEINQLSENCQIFNEKKRVSQFKEQLEENEHGLAKIMKENLRDILHEGLLDSVLPYMLPKSALSQPVIKKSTVVTDVKKNSSLGNMTENKTTTSIHKEYKEQDKEKNKINKKSLE